MTSTPPSVEKTRCCIVGGGPAGMMLGYLLARAGVATTVLEKHANFLRDFRGDTVHPSTLRVLDELGLLDAFLQRPHQRLSTIDGWFGTEHVRLGDFSGLPERHGFIAMMPQWEFLDFLAGEARRLPGFSLRMRSRVDGLRIDDAGRVIGVRGRAFGDDDRERDGGSAFEIDAGRAQVRQAAPFLGPRLDDIRSWDDVKLLTVAIDRLPRWSRPGLLCIGDAAHAMSPVGGVGINLAIQDAVSAANVLAARLRSGAYIGADDLDAVRRRRLWPTRVTQAMQVAIQDNVLVPAITGTEALRMPPPLRLVARTPALQRLLARLLGMGVRPEHATSVVA